ncbi:MAG: hypothetical protein KIT56_08710 [Gammaproteobacteria bacterium]|nr:hypothetical protein [Gammaproteobacteria bacterium]MCW5583937.1 hypothetical protein [Gammaproteobacteria bacterium]
MESRNNDQDNDDLSNLPDELLVGIGESSLSASDFINLPNTSPRFSLLFFDEHRLALKCLRQLLGHTALGEWEDAEGIWKIFPDLLIQRGTIYHRNPADITPEMNPGRYKYVNRTAYQIALMNEEYEEAEEMGKYMTEEEKQKQFAEVFPDGKMIKYNWDLKEAMRRLEAVFAEVIKDPLINENNLDVMSESTRAALNTLYEYVKPVPEHKIGLVFDANIYVEALKLYEEKFNDFKNKWDQRSFWCIRVEEHLASLLGTGYLRPHAQGICNKLTRTGCTLPDGSSYFAFRRPSSSVPGFHHFIGIYGGWGRPPLVAISSLFQKLCRARTRAGTELMRQYLRPSKSTCLVC